MDTKDYYKKNYGKIFNAVENPNWRIWKILDESGKCFQNKFQITTEKKLLKFINQAENPKALYVSISEFLNPHKNHGHFINQKSSVGERYSYPRKGYITADCLFLNSYFFIDLDHEEDLNLVQEEARKIIRNLKKFNLLKIYSIQFSGKKGIHLIYKMKVPLSAREDDPLKRIEYYKKQKEKYANIVRQLKLKTLDDTHINIMKDMFRVYAAPFSVKSHAGSVQPIKEVPFMRKNIMELISLNHTDKTMEAKANDKEATSDVGTKSLHPQPYRVDERDGLSSQPIYFKFVDNMIPGLKNNYVTILKHRKEDWRAKTIKKIQELYNLNDFYIYSIGDHVYSINYKPVQFQRLVKILRMAKSINLSFFMTRKHLPIPITSHYYKDGKLAGRMQFLAIVQNDITCDESRAHKKVFNQATEGNVGNELIAKGYMRVS